MWPFTRHSGAHRADLDHLADKAQRSATEAHEIADKAEPGLSELERRRPRNAIYEEVLLTLRRAQ